VILLLHLCYNGTLSYIFGGALDKLYITINMGLELKQETAAYWNSTFRSFENIPNYKWELEGFGPTILWAINIIKHSGFLIDTTKEMNVADFGCGPGFKTDVMYRVLSRFFNLSLTGIDASDESIAIANAINNNKKMSFESRWIDEHFTDSFDMIFCSGFAYAIGGNKINPERLQTIINNNLKRGGFFVYTHNTDLSGKISDSNWYNIDFNSFKTLEKFFSDQNYFTHFSLPQQHLSYYGFYKGIISKIKFFLLNSITRIRKKPVMALLIIRRPE
jgi:SAM-dependent methyltransferase